MSAEVELALAASARSWADALHRFLADHGGARVRTVVMGPEEASSESFQVLLIDDICSFLTPRLVEQVRRHGRLVVGVFDARDGADAKRRLLDCGVDDVIEENAGPEEFLRVVQGVVAFAPTPITPGVPAPVSRPNGRVVVVGGPPGGCGATEVAITMAYFAGGVLVDADDLAPSVSQRLGAPLLPNLRTAIDVVHHQSGDVDDTLHRSSGVTFLGGLATGSDWAQLHPGEAEAVVDELAERHATVVVNVGAGLERPQAGEGRFGMARGFVRRAAVVVAVGTPHPVGLTRLIRWVQEARVLAQDSPVHVVLNRAGRSPYERAEVEAEIERALPGSPVSWIPEDRRVAEAAWSGVRPPRGPFRKGVRRLVEGLGL